MPTFGTPTAGGGTGTSIIVPKPADLIVGRELLIAVRSQEGTTAVAWTAPAGFELKTAAYVVPSSPYRVAGLYSKLITEADLNPLVTGYTFTGPAGRNVGVAVRYDPDVDGDLVIAGISPYGGNSVASGIVTFSARTASGVGVTFIVLAAEVTAGISRTPSTIPAGFTQLANAQNTLDTSTSGSRTAIWLGYRVETTTSISAVTGGFAGASAVGGYATTLVGGKGAIVVPEPDGVPLQLSDGSTGYVTVLNTLGERLIPARIRPLLSGFESVAESLLVPGATMGHRGASAVVGMPEMSERAYDFSCMEGYPLLEFSTARTSDNVWIGVHDWTLNTTSETTGLGAVSDMTWAQVQTHLNSLNSAGNPVPYYRLDDFLDKYAATHVIHVDPKVSTNFMTSLLDVLDAHGGVTPQDARNRIVIKYVGTGPTATAVADAARTRGYKSAFYIYDTEVNSGVFLAEHSAWDLVGINWNASQAVFDIVKSVNKPIVVHIIPNQSAYNAAKTKVELNSWLNPGLGKTWIAQTSGTDVVIPVR